jgi:tetratricopeptide (TPR) repeat protein
MRFFIILRGYGLLLVVIFFVGLTQPKLKPEDLDSPTTAKEFMVRGKLYAKRGDYEQALADFNQAEQLQPRDRLAIYNSIYRNQAEALSELNRPAEAIEKYQKLKQKQQEDDLSTTNTDQKIAELRAKLK